MTTTTPTNTCKPSTLNDGLNHIRRLAAYLGVQPTDLGHELTFLTSADIEAAAGGDREAEAYAYTAGPLARWGAVARDVQKNRIKHDFYVRHSTLFTDNPRLRCGDASGLDLSDNRRRHLRRAMSNHDEVTYYLFEEIDDESFEPEGVTWNALKPVVERASIPAADKTIIIATYDAHRDGTLVRSDPMIALYIGELEEAANEERDYQIMLAVYEHRQRNLDVPPESYRLSRVRE